MNYKIISRILILLNMIVLLGQIWPEGTPPFARVVNILVLGLNLVYLSMILYQKKQSKTNP